jgi:hypothetical protein
MVMNSCHRFHLFDFQKAEKDELARHGAADEQCEHPPLEQNFLRFGLKSVPSLR